MTTPPQSVLFVCVHNSGKSQIAAAIARHEFPGVRVTSAGTAPSDAVHPGSADTLAQIGIDIRGERPQPITDGLIADADLVVVLGTEAQVAAADGTPVVRWEVDEPSSGGIEGTDRMRLVRDDIRRRVRELLSHDDRQPDAMAASGRAGQSTGVAQAGLRRAASGPLWANPDSARSASANAPGARRYQV